MSAATVDHGRSTYWLRGISGGIILLCQDGASLLPVYYRAVPPETPDWSDASIGHICGGDVCSALGVGAYLPPFHCPPRGVVFEATFVECLVFILKLMVAR